MSTSPAAWQTVFWALLPLATSTMSQPCGKVCSMPSAYRVFLRSSPIVCIADALSILIRLVAVSLYFRMSPWMSLDLLLTQRFAAEGGRNSAAELKEISRETLLRWLFFIIGTLPPAIKLMAITGVPWSRTWGMMFLVSFLVVEVLVLLAFVQPRYFSRYVHYTGSLFSRATSDPFTSSMWKMDAILGGSAVLAQIMIWFWVYLKPIGSEMYDDKKPEEKKVALGFWAAWAGYFFALGAGRRVYFAIPRRYARITRQVLGVLPATLIALLIYFFTAKIGFLILNVCIFTTELSVLWFFLAFFRGWLPSPDLSREGFSPRETELMEKFVYWATPACFEFFILNIFFSLVGYPESIIYNPATTVLPSWTVVFG